MVPSAPKAGAELRGPPAWKRHCRVPGAGWVTWDKPELPSAIAKTDKVKASPPKHNLAIVLSINYPPSSSVALMTLTRHEFLKFKSRSWLHIHIISPLAVSRRVLIEPGLY